MPLRVLLALLLVLLCVPTVQARPHSAPPRRHAEAIAIGKKALSFFLHREFRTAAEMYRRAAQVEPEEFAYVIGVGRSEAEDGRVAEAIAAYEEVVARAPAGHPLRIKAETALATLRERANAAPPVTAALPAPLPMEPAPAVPLAAPASAHTADPEVPAPVAAPQLVVDRPPPDANRSERPRLIAAWSLAGLGLVGAGFATWLGIQAQGDQDRLDALRMPDGRFNLARINYDGAVARQRSINDRWTGMGVLLGAAVVLEAVSIWLGVTSGPAPTQAVH